MQLTVPLLHFSLHSIKESIASARNSPNVDPFESSIMEHLAVVLHVFGDERRARTTLKARSRDSRGSWVSMATMHQSSTGDFIRYLIW